jgi:uncharacterized damage-inducible protein DinB
MLPGDYQTSTPYGYHEMNPMTSEEALLHIRYTGWASRRLLDAAKQLSPEALSKDLGVSHGSILGTLAHTFFGDSVWYLRAVDPTMPFPNPKEVPPLERLDAEWRELLQKWEAWAQKLSDVDLDKTVSYRLMDGSPFESMLKQVVLHVVNHATLHRGQVVALLRQTGVKPPATDLIFYYRELAAAR